MRLKSLKTIVGLGIAGLAALLLATAAVAAVLSSTVLVDGSSVHLRVTRTVADGFDSGWHTHPGMVIVQVQEGSLQISQGSCTPKTVNVGDTYVEVPFVPARAVATGRAVWTTTFLVRYEDPLASPMPTSPCP